MRLLQRPISWVPELAQLGQQPRLGVIVCIFMLHYGSANLALAGVLGEMKLKVYDTVAYMPWPALVFLRPACLISKPVPGAGGEGCHRGQTSPLGWRTILQEHLHGTGVQDSSDHSQRFPATRQQVMEEDLHGCPVGFALKAFQQEISLFCF